MTVFCGKAGLLFAWLALAGCSGPAGPTQEAGVLGKRFCAAVMAGDEGATVALMTPALQAKVARVKAFDAGWRQRNPTEKPPLGDGLRLTAWQDAPQSCTPGAATADTLVLTYVPAGAPAEFWRDTLVLAEVGGNLRVADIRYEPRTGGCFTAWLNEALQSPG